MNEGADGSTANGDAGPGTGGEPAAGPARPLALGRLLCLQGLLVAGASGVSAALGAGSPAAIAAGALVFAASFVLQAQATRFALSARRRPALAMGLFGAKLLLLLGLATWGLARAGLEPMSFAVGATTLLLAIVIDTCYPDGSSRRSTRRSPTA